MISETFEIILTDNEETVFGLLGEGTPDVCPTGDSFCAVSYWCSWTGLFTFFGCVTPSRVGPVSNNVSS